MITDREAERILGAYERVKISMFTTPSTLCPPEKRYSRRHDRAVIFKVDTERQIARSGRPFRLERFREQLELGGSIAI